MREVALTVLKHHIKTTSSSLLHAREVEKAGVHIWLTLQVREMEEGAASRKDHLRLASQAREVREG